MFMEKLRKEGKKEEEEKEGWRETGKGLVFLIFFSKIVPSFSFNNQNSWKLEMLKVLMYDSIDFTMQ